MKAVSHPHGRATIRTGGAAKCVSVPPIDTFTNSRPSVAYFNRAARLAVEELPREQQRADRHRRRLGDERPEQRADRQDGHPPRRRRRAAEARDAAQRRFREADDRARRGERHDHHHEQRLGVVHRVVQIVRRREPALARRSARSPAPPPTVRTPLPLRRGNASPPRARSAAAAAPARAPARRRGAGCDARARRTTRRRTCGRWRAGR